MSSESVVLTLPPDASEELIERVKTAFPDAMLATEATASGSAHLELEAALALSVVGAGGLGGVLSDWWSALPGGASSLFLLAAAMLAAYAVERGVRALAARNTQTEAYGAGDGPTPSLFSRLQLGLHWLIGRLLSLVIFAVAARLIGRVVLPPEPALRDLGLGILAAVLFGRAAIGFIDALTARDHPPRRMMAFSDHDAAYVFRTGFTIAVALIALRILRVFLLEAAGNAPETQLALIVFALANGAASAAFFVLIREPVARLMVQSDGGIEASGWMGWLASRWHWAFAGLITVDAVLKVLGILGMLGQEALDGTGPVVFVVMVASLAVASLAAIRRQPEMEARGGLWLGALVLAEGFVILGASVLLLKLWGIDPLSPNTEGGLTSLIPGLVEAGMIVAVGIALWRASAILISSSAGDGDDTDDGGDGMGGEGSRLETVVPILRGFALTVIAVTTAMSALAAVGMNIGPLLASAGVVGLAVGFGAQKLVSDVISGLFYLYEDAFRLGEYVVTDAGKGTVERISIRSARLRHHNGPIYTVPFSAMGTIQNHSRDYVVMKFSFQVPEDTDVEMVRKLVKKAGAELANDPELEGKLIAPLKSQGAVSIQGRSFEIGCKFTARPGQQFVIRRKAYVALQRALQNAGIELFAPTITLTPGEPGAPLASGAPT
ncbi:MAG: mechanosensitive ion channel domain-containing protein [Pseudomonadota bacterium]